MQKWGLVYLCQGQLWLFQNRHSEHAFRLEGLIQNLKIVLWKKTDAELNSP